MAEAVLTKIMHWIRRTLKKLVCACNLICYARVARYRRVHHRARSADRGSAAGTHPPGEPFLLRTAQPPLASAEGRAVTELRRIGKRIAIGLEGDLWLVLHLMIAGRLHWRPQDAKLAGRQNLAAFDFPNGSLVLTEAGRKHRASLHLVSGVENLSCLRRRRNRRLHRRSGSFRAVMTAENHTLKRALTDPRLLSGVGNAYSDEILHAAQLSPIMLHEQAHAERLGKTIQCDPADTSTLDRAAFAWKRKSRFPEKVTHFAKTWQPTDATDCLARGVATRFCGFATPTKKQTIVRAAKQAARSWRTEVCRACLARTGRAHWMSWKL